MYKIIRGAVSSEICSFASDQFKLYSEKMNYEYRSKEYIRKYIGEQELSYPFGDSQIPESFTVYGFIAFENLLLKMKPIVENVIQKDLLPTYSYGRIYYNGAELKRHKDRPSCEYSATLTLSTDGTPWSIFMEGEPIDLDVGDICVYTGNTIEHWREPYKGEQQIQVFLHYVEKKVCVILLMVNRLVF